jgi:hypothetical protein
LDNKACEFLNAGNMRPHMDLPKALLWREHQHSGQAKLDLKSARGFARGYLL